VSEREREELLLMPWGEGRELFMFKMKGFISINRVRKVQQFLY
jgi:hypothetical protein